ncbi:hypothetical protein JL107_18675 [Nakamurella flavida]|uniref:ANTAR domain-containing protein n=1 Tax=Nakamurella flavida TaxID=363630 RepID=A0A938YTA8_9ACTN|nr:hypothetical protein [Nakamurella flavida]MBM9478480.1 hypothetical protein [Nakamurella flavida]MDP9777694.1 hypothetical protein [Nakamurella flavida]
MLSTLTEPAAVRASMRMNLRAGSADPSHLVFEFFAGDPDAFTGLAGDARAALGASADVLLDPHRDTPRDHHPWPGGGPDPAAAGELDQAIGVLLVRGHADPRAALDEYAARRGLTRPAAARHILDSLGGGHPQ